MYKDANPLETFLWLLDFRCVHACMCKLVRHGILFLLLLDVNKKGACLWSPTVVFAVLFITMVAVCSVFIAWKASALCHRPAVSLSWWLKWLFFHDLSYLIKIKNKNTIFTHSLKWLFLFCILFWIIDVQRQDG